MMLTAIVTNPVERTRFVKFAIVGSVGALVDFAVFNLLANLLGVHPVLASVISFSVAVVSNFTWNRLWTYPDSRSKPLGRQFAEFALVNLIGGAIRTPIFALLHLPLERVFTLWEAPSALTGLTPAVLGNNLALAIVMVIIMFWNFFVNRYWTYNDVD
ncbi:MAG: GtrA family protein [Anaerolineae bacterium]|nr:MAG: GtrA family protein [Anaerolineae bacterium]